MSMNGDFPDLSNFCPGTMGSCQYSTLRSGSALVVVFAAASAALLDAPSGVGGALVLRLLIQYPTPPPTIRDSPIDPSHIIWRFMVGLRRLAHDSWVRRTEN